MGKYWEPLKKLTSWRKISVGMWDPPSDPTIYGHEVLDVTETLDYLDEVSEVSGTKVTMTALVVKAFAIIYERYPELNVMIVNGRIQKRKSIDAFCQVAVPDSSESDADLSGVKMRAVNERDLVEISEGLRGRARQLRAGQDEEIEQTKALIDKVPPWLIKPMLSTVNFLTYNVPADLDAVGVRSDPFGSFMVSSIAQFDLRLGYAPLVPASRCPVVVLPGVVHEAPMVVDGDVVARKAICIGCTFDHRCFDGYQIGQIVRSARALISHPYENMPAPSEWAADAERGNPST